MPVLRPFTMCVRCDMYMTNRSVEKVRGPSGAIAYVRIFECPGCGKLAAEEIGSAVAPGPSQAA